jgi:hypothetical protein
MERYHRLRPPLKRCGANRCSARTTQTWSRWFDSVHRSVSGLQTLTVKSRLLTGEKCWRTARCANSRRPTISASVVKCIIILRFERRVCRWESCRMHQIKPR